MEIPIVPEQAAADTEARWLAKSQGELGQGCGWCKLDGALVARWGEFSCKYCPVRRIFGCGCGIVAEVAAYYAATSERDAAEAARGVYELAVRMRSALIAEAYEILGELGY